MPEARFLLFGVLGGDGLRPGVSRQPLAIHASRLVKLAKNVHHPGRREADFNHLLSLPWDIHIHVLLGVTEVV